MSSFPNIIAPASPVFLDLTVKELQNRLALAKYTDVDASISYYFASGLIFGIAERDVETNEPKLYVGSDKARQEYFSLEPNDRARAFCFFYESAPRQQTDRNNFVADLSLVVWFDQSRFDNVSSRLQEPFINEVVQQLILNNYKYQEGSLQIFTRQSDVFADFTLNEQTGGYLSAPYDGFRIRFRTRSYQDCAYTYTVTNTGC